MKKINTNGYNIYCGEGALNQFDFSNYTKIAILVDENTRRCCLPIFLKNHSNFKDTAYIIELSSGEINKNLQSCHYIWEYLTKNEFAKDSILINLGGGVLSDLGGFCASTYKRGIDFINIPTTLLAMVDASIGGKLAINFLGLKNQIGTFKDPKSVLIDVKFLSTLNNRELLSGFAEVIKHSLIACKDYWDLITNTPFDSLDLEEIVFRSLVIKNDIVLNDPFEQGERKKLNFGHTYGHAIESFYLSKGDNILHGEAIALGIVKELSLSDIQQKQKIIGFIRSIFLDLPRIPSLDELLPFLSHDKKNSGKKINFSLLKSIGECTIDNMFSADEL